MPARPERVGSTCTAELGEPRRFSSGPLAGGGAIPSQPSWRVPVVQWPDWLPAPLALRSVGTSVGGSASDVGAMYEVVGGGPHWKLGAPTVARLSPREGRAETQTGPTFPERGSGGDLGRVPWTRASGGGSLRPKLLERWLGRRRKAQARHDKHARCPNMFFRQFIVAWVFDMSELKP